MDFFIGVDRRPFGASGTQLADTGLTPEERHEFYKLVRFRVVIYPNCDLEISWAGGEGLLFSTSETVPW
jgi:hypothetical protein